MIVVKSIKEKPEECRGCRFLDESTYDCLINSESPAYTTLEGQYEHCPIEEHPDINVGNMDTTTHDPIPAKTGKNDGDGTSGDCISRTQEIEAEAVSKWKKEFREYVDSLDIARDDWKGIIEHIEELPSAQPERKTGRWIPDNTDYYRSKFICSACGESEEVPTTGFGYGTMWDYCPMCGAKMKEGEQE